MPAETRLPGTPLHLSTTPVQMRLAPLLLGQHTDEILADTLGLDDGTVANLQRARTV